MSGGFDVGIGDEQHSSGSFFFGQVAKGAELAGAEDDSDPRSGDALGVGTVFQDHAARPGGGFLRVELGGADALDAVGAEDALFGAVCSIWKARRRYRCSKRFPSCG